MAVSRYYSNRLFVADCLIIASILHFNLASVDGSSFNKPHPHQGLNTPYKPEAPKVNLDKNALKLLENGKLYKTQILEGESGRGLVVLDVNAPTATVWSRILDYDNYSRMVPGCTQSQNYKVIDHKPTKSNDFLTQNIYTRQKIGLSVVQLEYFIKHSYHPRHKVLTWTLDYTKESDLDDSVGYWYVVERPGGKSNEEAVRTRVFYSVDVRLPSWIPGFVKDFISTKALVDATAWVKKESEREYQHQTIRKGSVVGGDNNGDNNIHNDKKKVGLLQTLAFWNKGKSRSNGKASASGTTPQTDKTRSDKIMVRGGGDDFNGMPRGSVAFSTICLILYGTGYCLDTMSRQGTTN